MNTNRLSASLTEALNDWVTWNFMQWFVKEQTEEETFGQELLDKLKIAGGKDIDHSALYTFDRDLQTTPDNAVLAQDVSAENP